MTYLAVFDWNGTLFDDTSATLAATNACLAAVGTPLIDLPILQETSCFPLIHFYERVGVKPDVFLAQAEALADIWQEVYARESLSSGLAEGAVALLDWLEGKGVHSMILSNHTQSHLDADVDRLGIRSYMRHVSGNEHRATITQGLSKQIRLEAYMAEHGFLAEKAFIVGDSHEEPELARRLGLLGVSVSGGLLSATRLEKYKADHIVDRLDEVRSILENCWSL